MGDFLLMMLLRLGSADSLRVCASVSELSLTKHHVSLFSFRAPCANPLSRIHLTPFAPFFLKPIQNPSKTHQQMTGNMEVHADGRVASHGSFGTVVGNVSFTRGRWYYEVELESSGLLQIGWATDKFQADSNQGQVWVEILMPLAAVMRGFWVGFLQNRVLVLFHCHWFILTLAPYITFSYP